jgi:hypothetical protein
VPYDIQIVVATVEIAVLSAFLWQCSRQIRRAVDHLLRQNEEIRVLRCRLEQLEEDRDAHEHALSTITLRVGHLPVPGERGNPGK